MIFQYIFSRHQYSEYLTMNVRDLYSYNSEYVILLHLVQMLCELKLFLQLNMSSDRPEQWVLI